MTLLTSTPCSLIPIKRVFVWANLKGSLSIYSTIFFLENMFIMLPLSISTLCALRLERTMAITKVFLQEKGHPSLFSSVNMIRFVPWVRETQEN
jgi:hypothetical protein